MEKFLPDVKRSIIRDFRADCVNLVAERIESKGISGTWTTIKGEVDDPLERRYGFKIVQPQTEEFGYGALFKVGQGKAGSNRRWYVGVRWNTRELKDKGGHLQVAQELPRRMSKASCEQNSNSSRWLGLRTVIDVVEPKDFYLDYVQGLQEFTGEIVDDIWSFFRDWQEDVGQVNAKLTEAIT